MISNLHSVDALKQGLTHYHSNQYLQALEHFTNCQPQDNLTSVTLSTLTGITHMQMHNYNLAAQELQEVRMKLAETVGNRSERGELALLKVKALTGMLVIMLVGGGEQAEEVFSELMEFIGEQIESNKALGIGLFEQVIRSMFGVSSFTQLQQRIESILSRKVSLRNKNQVDPALLSSLSIYSHLSGNLHEAVQLQQLSLSLCTHNLTLKLIALKHLEELCKAMFNNKNTAKYQKQLKQLMQHEEMQGVAEETLFRNYSTKIENTSRIVAALIEREKQWKINTSAVDSRQRIAVVWHLKKQKTRQNRERIEEVLRMVQEDESALTLMNDSQFVQEATREHARAIQQFAYQIQAVLIYKAFASLKNNSQNHRHTSNQTHQSRVIEIDLKGLTMLESSKDKTQNTPIKNDSFNNSPSRHHNHSVPQTIEEHQSEESLPKGVAQSRIVNAYGVPKNRVYLDGVQASMFAPSSDLAMKDEGQKSAVKVNQSRVQVDPLEEFSYKSRAQFREKEIKKDEQRSPKGQKYNISKTHSRVEKKGRAKVEKASPLKTLTHRNYSSTLSHYARSRMQPLQIHEQPLPQNQVQRQQPSPTAIPPPPPPSVEPDLKYRTEQSPDRFTFQRVPAKSTLPPKPSRLYSESDRPLHSTQMTVAHSQIIKPVVHQHKHSRTSPESSSRVRSHLRGTPQQRFEYKLKRCIGLCQSGQYLEKKHFTSDGGAQRFLRLTRGRDRLMWGQTEQAVDLFQNNKQSCMMEDVKGIIFGKVTPTLRKECNHKLQPWKCFSLVLHDRTRDFYCIEEKDLLFWLPGLSACLYQNHYRHRRYHQIEGRRRLQEPRTITLGDRNVPRLYSIGRVLWRRCLMRLKTQYLKGKGKQRRHNYFCANAYAVVVAAVKKTGYKLQYMRRYVS